MCKKLLFDGETSLKGARNQKIIQKETGIDVMANPFYKRSLAEIFIKSLKFKMSILLRDKGKSNCLFFVNQNSY
jgi:hypothetical protein